VVGDIGEPDTLGPLADVDVVFHLASLLKMPWKRTFHTVNADGTRNVATACAASASSSPTTLVVVSSLAAAGPSPMHPRTEADGAQPVSIYGRVKLEAEAAAIEFAGYVPTTIVRPPMVFGEGDTSVLKAYRGAARGWHAVPGFRDRRVSFVHAADLADALIAAAQRGERVAGGVGTGVYYVADDHQPTYGDFGRLIGRALDRRVRLFRLPRPVFWCAAAISEAIARLRDRPSLLNLDKYREAMAGSWLCDSGKAREQLGFDPQPPEVRLRQTADWYREQGWL